MWARFLARPILAALRGVQEGVQRGVHAPSDRIILGKRYERNRRCDGSRIITSPVGRVGDRHPIHFVDRERRAADATSPTLRLRETARSRAAGRPTGRSKGSKCSWFARRFLGKPLPGNGRTRDAPGGGRRPWCSRRRDRGLVEDKRHGSEEWGVKLSSDEEARFSCRPAGAS
jgi:hypothetical protein